MLTARLRCRYHRLQCEFDWNHFRSFTSLSVLLLVRAAVTLSTVANAVPNLRKVSTSHSHLCCSPERLLRLCILSAVEYAWNVYPSTVVSSGMLVTANVLTLIGVWHGYPMGTSQSDSGVKTD